MYFSGVKGKRSYIVDGQKKGLDANTNHRDFDYGSEKEGGESFSTPAKPWGEAQPCKRRYEKEF